MAFSACSLSSLFCLLLRICRAKNLLASLRGTKQSPTIQSEYSGLEYLLSFMVSLMAAKAYFFCLDTKETKNQVSRKASLPHLALALQIRQNLGWELLPRLRYAHCHYASAKIPLCPATTQGHHCFACFRPKLFY